MEEWDYNLFNLQFANDTPPSTWQNPADLITEESFNWSAFDEICSDLGLPKADAVDNSKPSKRALKETEVKEEEPLDDKLLDKKKRNSAASAKFRLKKKQHEMYLEKQVQFLNDRVVQLEMQLEMAQRESALLKQLIFSKLKK